HLCNGVVVFVRGEGADPGDRAGGEDGAAVGIVEVGDVSADAGVDGAALAGVGHQDLFGDGLVAVGEPCGGGEEGGVGGGAEGAVEAVDLVTGGTVAEDEVGAVADRFVVADAG